MDTNGESTNSHEFLKPFIYYFKELLVMVSITAGTPSQKHALGQANRNECSSPQHGVGEQQKEM
jgi:hypothetical protein